MVHSWATNADDTTVDPRWGKVGKQKIKDAGELCPKRMETVDDEIRDKALAFIDKAKGDGKPFFLWLNPTRMHIVTHLSHKYQALRNSKNGWSIQEAGMAQMDDDIGIVMKKLKDMGVDDNTIVVFTTDNGTEVFTWPDGGQTPFAQSEGHGHGRRLPRACDDPLAGQGAGRQGRERHHLRAGLAADACGRRGQPEHRRGAEKRQAIGGRTYKNHLDGYNQMDMITGKGPSNRHEIFYFGESSLGAVRIDDYKYRFIDQPGGWLGEKTHARRAVPDQPAPRSVRAHGLAGSGTKMDRRIISTWFQVRVLALRVRPAGRWRSLP